MRYKITFGYDGTNYHGYQKQEGYLTIEECIENALYSINNHKKTKIVSSGRTDKGVHARAQVAHFDIDVDITEYKLKCAINSLIPNDIHIITAEKVDDNFHARYMVKQKKYVYYLNIGEYDPISKNYVYQYNRTLNIENMKAAITHFVGEHDFENFVSSECIKESYVRKIYEACIECDENIIKFTFIGNGFMKYQVRNMVGTLLKIGQGKLKIEDIEAILKDKKRKNDVLTIKPEGLYLEEVIY